MLKEHAIIVLLIWNVLVMLVYGLDKLKARKGAWRIPEKTLILMAALMGGVGAYAGMKVFHHKTKHRYFQYGFPALLTAQLALVVWLTYSYS